MIQTTLKCNPQYPIIYSKSIRCSNHCLLLPNLGCTYNVIYIREIWHGSNYKCLLKVCTNLRSNVYFKSVLIVENSQLLILSDISVIELGFFLRLCNYFAAMKGADWLPSEFFETLQENCSCNVVRLRYLSILAT